MKKFRKALSVLVMTAMVTSIASCGLVKDKSMDEIADLAEDVCKYTADLDYKKLSKMTEDGDEDLEAMFEGIEDDDFRKIVASTLEYEIDEDSLEKDGKTGYTIDVTFTYVNYEEVLEDDEIFSVDDFEDAVDDCDEVVEESITLEFEKDGDDILFTNISDLEDLFPYWDEEFNGDAAAAVEDDEDEDEDDDEPDATPTPTPAPTTAPTTSPATYDSDYPNPADYNEEGVCVLLHDTNILFTYPQGTTNYGTDAVGADDYIMLYGWNDDMSCMYNLNQGGGFSCYEDFVLDMRDDGIESLVEYTWHYESHTVETLTMVVGDYQYDGLLATVTSTDGDISYAYYVVIGNENYYYLVSVEADNIDFIYDFMTCFGYVE